MKRTLPSRDRTATAIRDLLARDRVCLELVHYLTRNSDAVDSTRGIAEWWIKRDVPSTQEALLRLQEWGVVQSYAVQDGTFVYAYTKNQILRRLLARYVQELAAPDWNERL